MSEYIVKCSEVVGISGKALIVPDYVDTSKEVVRCRDCVHFDSKRDGCWWFAHAERQSDYSWADEPSDVEPDGFCSYGKRKEGGDD